MLAATYLQAKATCDQVSALDAVLDKELMLEAMQQVSVRDPILNFKIWKWTINAAAPWLQYIQLNFVVHKKNSENRDVFMCPTFSIIDFSFFVHKNWRDL